MRKIKLFASMVLSIATITTSVPVFAGTAASPTEGEVCPHGYDLTVVEDEGLIKTTKNESGIFPMDSPWILNNVDGSPAKSLLGFESYQPLANFQKNFGIMDYDCEKGSLYFVYSTAEDGCKVAIVIYNPGTGSYNEDGSLKDDETIHEFQEAPYFSTKAPSDHMQPDGNGGTKMKTFDDKAFSRYDKQSLNGMPYYNEGDGTCANQGGYYEAYKCKNCTITRWKYVVNKPKKCVDDNFDSVCDKCGETVARAATPSKPQALSVTANSITLRTQTSPQGTVLFSFDGKEYSPTRVYSVEPGTTHTIKVKVFTPENSTLLDSIESDILTITTQTPSSPIVKPTPTPVKKNNSTIISTTSGKTQSYKSTYSSSSIATKAPTPSVSNATKKSIVNTSTSPSKISLHNKTTYIVLKGDTLKSIAAAFKTSEAKIRQKNKMSATDKIKVGQELIIWNGTEIDNGEPESIEQSPLKSDPRLSGTISTDGTKYKMGDGDSIIDVADAAGIDFGKFIKVNSIDKCSRYKISSVLKVK